MDVRVNRFERSYWWRDVTTKWRYYRISPFPLSTVLGRREEGDFLGNGSTVVTTDSTWKVDSEGGTWAQTWRKEEAVRLLGDTS